MRIRLRLWRAAARLARLPGIAGALARLEPGAGWRDFTPTAHGVEEVTLDVRAGGAAFEDRAVALLRRHGVVVLTGLTDPATVSAARDEAREFLAPFEALWAAGARGQGSHDGVRWVAAPKNRVDVLADTSPAVTLSTAGGDDAGNIGVIRADRLASERRMRAIAALCGSPAQQIVAAIVARVHGGGQCRFDLLKKAGVTGPQTAHVDTWGAFYYAFQYLNDIDDAHDGPYAYLMGSHRREDLLARDILLNRLRGRPPRDMPYLADRLTPLTGPAGAIVLSCQRGVHGGLPQQPGRVRWALQTTIA